MDRRGVIRLAKRAAKLALGALVVAMVARHLAATWGEIRSYGAAIRFEPAWLATSGIVYLAGLSCFGVFFGRILDGAVGRGVALRAYLIGHLGKYVPGKALVVVMRVGLVAPYGARPATAAFATLYETLVMMAAGGVLAGVLFAAGRSGPIDLPIGGGRQVPISLAVLGFALGLPLLAASMPRVFPRLAMAVSVPFPNVGRDALPKFSARLLIEGLALSAAGWTLLGLSLAAAIRGFEPGGLPIGDWPMAIAASALATVGGFLVAIFPGGLVVREAVLMAALGPTLGAEAAVVAALVLRLVWVVAELAVGGLLAMLRPSGPSRGAIERAVAAGAESIPRPLPNHD